MSANGSSDAASIALDRADFGALLERIPDAVVLFDQDVIPITFNPAARAIDQWLSNSPELPTQIPHHLADALRRMSVIPPDQKSRLTEIALTAASGEMRRYTLILSSQSTEHDSGARYLVVLTQIRDETTNPIGRESELEIVHARLKDIQNQLLQSEKLASIGQLAAGVAHEINNPIGYIHSNLGTLQEYISNLFSLIDTYEALLRELQAPRTERWREVEALKQRVDYEFLVRDLPLLLTESREGVDRVRKIVQDLRDFSHAGHAEQWTLTDLHRGLDSTLNIVWNELKYKAEVRKEYGEVPLVECLPSQLNQVFMNLLVNAGHAIEGRGKIVIATRADAEFAYIEISDTGKGIDSANLGRIFDPFFTTKAVGQGTGLGLSLSYGIVRKHGGQIDVRSEVGNGTTFLITLPLKRPPAEPGNTAPGMM